MSDGRARGARPAGTEVGRALVATFVARTAANTALRLVYPFLPAIARGLQVSPGSLGIFVALRNLGGLATPAAARASERYGRRWMMLVAMLTVVAGSAFSALGTSLALVGVGIVAVGLAKPAFDISMQAWFGDRVPYRERGRIFGITELTWSVALLLIVPAGRLIELTSWRVPFAVISLLAALGAVAVARGLRSDVPMTRVAVGLELTPQRLRALAAVLLFSAAAENTFIVYGQWLEGSLGLSLTSIGAFTLVVVVAELLGEGIVTVFSDRWGLRRSVLGGLVTSAVAYLCFAVTGSSLLVAGIVVAVWIAAFEVTIVAAIPFVTGLTDRARDRLLSSLAVTIALGRAVGALSGQALYDLGGIGGAGAASAACVVVAAVLLSSVSEPEQRALSADPNLK